MTDIPVKEYTAEEYREIIVTMGNSLGALFMAINNSAVVANDILAVLSQHREIVAFCYREYLKSQGLEVPEEFNAGNGDSLAGELFKFTKDKGDGDLVM